MNRKALTVLAFAGWGLFALSLFSHAPAGEPRGGIDAALTPNCPADIAPAGGDGQVNVNDLLAVINAWGPCPGGCQTASDCDDANPCTADACINGVCQNIQLSNCCTVAGNCTPVPNATVGCLGNQCVIIGCSPGFLDCNGLYSDGCEVNRNTDPQNCGGCGVVCVSLPNANVGCVNGSCVFLGCLPGFADCNSNLTDGCEASLNNSPQHCGTCNSPCLLPNAAAVFVNGTCAIGFCNVGFADCDGIVANGCETNTNTNLQNCGGCNMPCPTHFHCQAGICVPN